MRVAINLATRPYVEFGPLYKRLRLLIAALALLSLPLWLLLRTEARKASQVKQQLAGARKKVDTLERQRQSYQADMRQPQNASVLQQAQFLNQLFARKAFSWTAVMMDLENVLPSGVQVLNIDPIIARNGDVTIRLRVSGQRDRAVEFVRNLEHSHRFLLPRLAGETAETTSQGGRGFEPVSSGGVNFDILADYNPLPTPAAKAEAKKSTASGAPKSAADHGARKHKPKPGHPGAPSGIPSPHPQGGAR